MAAANHTSASSINYSDFISNRAKLYQPSAIRGLFPLEKIPGMISFLAGKPNPQTFPIQSMSIDLKPVGDAQPITLKVQGKDMEDALQYGPTAGLPALVQFLQEFQQHVHQRGDPQKEGWTVSMGSGSADCYSKTFYALLDEGDSILVETPCYPGTLGCLRGLACNVVEIGTDSEGLRADLLEQTLSSWPTEKRPPKAVYTMPVGSNPGGTTATEKRKRQILEICKKHNILILEDDAYYFLSYGDQEQARSYFSLEHEVNGEFGRVIRFDSFSKILASGIRLGFMTAPKEIATIVDLITANNMLQVSSTTQAIALALFKHWQIDGLITHTRRVAQFYKNQKDMFEAIAKKHLDGLASWTSPTAGMFLYLNLHIPSGDSEDLIKNKAVKAGFLAVPGTSCTPAGSKTSYVRTSFSLADPESTEEAFKRLAKLLREETGSS